MILQACSHCARQYDVTAHAPGTEVRCLCDRVFAVSHRMPLGVAALVCRHCGGAVGAEDATCPWCAAALDERDRRASTLCPACFARIEDEARHCRACGIAIAPQHLTPLRAGAACPRCAGGLRLRDLGPTDVVECSSCEGLWLEPRAFEDVCREARARPDVVLPGAEAVPRASIMDQEVTYIPCLTCGELMQRRQFRHVQRASGVVIDVCREHGVWLDHSELENVVAFVRRSDADGPGPLPRPLPGVGRPAPPLFEAQPRLPTTVELILNVLASVLHWPL